MKNCLIVINTYKKESQTLSLEIKKFLQSKNVNCSFLEFNGFSENYPFSGFDFIITLGGDGTVLYACRGCSLLGIPVFPINLGQFGFIAGINKEHWKENLEKFLDNKLQIFTRTLISYKVYRDDKEINCGCGLNDIVVHSKTPARTINLDLSCNKISLGQCKTDGLIISSSTGSTAYSASAGGPIVDPDVNAFVLTPINPFSLSMRPLVISSSSTLHIKIMSSREKSINLTVDGQKPFELKENDEIKITQLEKLALLVGTSKEKFYNALRFKLNWAGGPHA